MIARDDRNEGEQIGENYSTNALQGQPKKNNDFMSVIKEQLMEERKLLERRIKEKKEIIQTLEQTSILPQNKLTVLCRN